jgi:hypothetical protein
MGLGHKGQSPPPCLDWRQFSRSRGNGSHRQCLYNGYVNQHLSLLENRTPTQRLLSPMAPQRWDAPLIHIFLLYVSSTSALPSIRVRQPALRYGNPFTPSLS